MKRDRRCRRPKRRVTRGVAAVALATTFVLGAVAGCAAAVPGQATIRAGAEARAVATSPHAPEPPAPTTVTQTMEYTETVTPGADPTTGPTTDLTPASANADERLYKDTASAVTFTEGFWNDTFRGWDVVWHGPSLWAGNGFYDSDDRDRPGADWWMEGPSCAGERADAMNAGYCTSGEVAWDRALMRDGYTAFGHSFVYVTVAHEWAHAAQQRFIADGEAPAVLAQQELQADCLAGTTIAGAVKLGYLQLEIGDTEELTATLEAMGDERTWRTSDDHGSGAERVSWFRTGFNGDIESCLGNA